MKHAIGRRFGYTVGANLFRAATNFSTAMMLARWLGPEDYGKLAFLLGTFIAARQLVDLGTSAAFFTFLSQTPRSVRFVRGFFRWMGVQFFVAFVTVGLLFPSFWIETIWQGEERGLVLAAFAAVFLQHSVWPVIQQAGESQRRTFWVQGIGAVVAGVHILSISVLWFFGVLGLYAVFAAIAVEYLLAAIVAHRRFTYEVEPNTEPTSDAPNSTMRMYVAYCLPLVPYSLVGFADVFADKWLLQKFGGGVEQAYYAVGAQFAMIALLATSSALTIFWKEIAEANHSGDRERMGRLYKMVTRLLFLVGAVVAAFLMPWAEELVLFILGDEYAGGAAALTIMFLYPVHQSLGQINGTMMYATERVGLHVVLGTIFTIIGMTVTYFVLAPPDAVIPGLGLASRGLALKMVALQMVSVNVLGFVISRIQGWKFDWLFQPVALFGCLVLGWGAHALVTATIAPAPLPVQLVVAGLLYLVFVTMLVFSIPSLVGRTRSELITQVSDFWPRG